jgi:iron complex outermembrane receptor protein
LSTKIRSVVATLVSLATLPVFAQQKPANGNELDEIIVTATRQATNLQDTPIAITAVTSETLEDMGLKSVADLSAVVPNAQFRRAQGAFGPGVTTFIRGLGTGDTSLGGEANVAYYIDDVYYPILLGSNFDLLDIDHIEVLRGPQGTLFGRNALAGAVNIVSKQPAFGEATGYGQVTVGRNERRELRGGFNLPIGDNAALMVSGVSKNRQGYQKVLDFSCEMIRRGTPQLAGTLPLYNPQLAVNPSYAPDNCVIGHQGGEDSSALRSALRWKVTDKLMLTLGGDYTWDDSENPADSMVDFNPAAAPTWFRSQMTYFGMAVDDRFETGNPYTTYASYVDRIPAGTVVAGSTFYNGRATRGGNIIDPINHLKHWGLSGKAQYDINDDIGLTFIYGHREMDETHAFDNDGSPLVAEHVQSAIGEHYDNAELRISGKQEWVDWVAGLFYFDAFGYFHATNYSQPQNSVRAVDTTYEPNSKAAFANATLRPFDNQKLSFVLGARYSKDHKYVVYSNHSDIQPSGSDYSFIVDPGQRKFSWKLGVNYEIADYFLTYASVATGNSLPGYNARPLQKTQIFQTVGNDNRAYEIGAKYDLFDKRLRLNAAVFYTDWIKRAGTVTGAEPTLDATTGQPIPGNQQLEPLPNGPEGSTRCSATTVPAGTGIVCLSRAFPITAPGGDSRGFEVEYTATPIEGLLINGSVGWSKFMSPTIKAASVHKRQTNPFWTANSGIQYAIAAPVLAGRITPRLDWTYQSSEITNNNGTKYDALTKARSVFNTRLSYDKDEGGFSAAFGVTNLFNKFYYLNFFDYQLFGWPQTEAQPAQPRQWYLTLSKKF